MSNIKVMIAGRDIKVADGYEKPSAGDVNTCSVSLVIEHGGVWDSLPHKRVTFSTRTASVTVDYAPTIAVPHEVLESPGALYLTLTGYDADGIEVARTHRMTYPIEVAKAGADEGTEPTPATLDVVSRIDNLASTLEASETTRQEAFESAQNERSAAFQSNMNEWSQDVAESVSQVSTTIETANDAATNANEAATLANEAADNANETANQIKQRADSGEFNGSDGYSPTANVTKDGGTATIIITDKNGTTTATVSDGAPGSDAAATDVRINGKSITVDGVADIPAATQDGLTYGVLKLGGNSNGLRINRIGELAVVDANNRVIDIRSGGSYPITTQGFDYAVKAAMCDGKGAAWTADEQKAARERMNAADANKVYIMQKQIANLQGIAATEETDSTEAYTKTVPAGAQKWASLDKVGGKTVVWNQLANRFRSGTTSDAGLTFANNGDGSFTINGTVGGGDLYHWIASIDVVRVGRKYALLGSSKNVRLYLKGYNNQQSANGEACIMSVIENTSDIYIYCSYDFGAVINNEIVRPQLIDITAMFGAGNEPTTLDDPRIAFIKAYAEEHPEYNPGELMSAEVVEVESKGKNLLNPATTENGFIDPASGLVSPTYIFLASDYIEVSPGVTYTYSNSPAGTGAGYAWYDSGKSYISGVSFSGTQTTRKLIAPSNAKYLRVSIRTELLDVSQLERGTTATDYSPYGVKGTFPIPEEVRDMCPGYGWSAGTVYNEIDFERKVYVQRVGSVDLSILTWTKYDIKQGTLFRSSEVQTALVASNENIKYNMTCAPYISTSSINRYDKTISRAKTNIRNFDIIDSSYTDAASFKSAMAGVLLYYELAEPVEVDLSDVLSDDNFIEVEAGGTVTFKQASTQLPVPSYVTYQISTSEVIANA